LALPIVAIIGRPNVGKSTLVNRLCQSRQAIVHDEPGVTRDRTYQDGFWRDRDFKVVDTGGLVFDDDSEFLPEIREQANLALEEAVVALVLVDGQEGVTTADESIAQFLRSHSCKTLVVVNKCESPEQGLAMAAEFWKLGLGEPYPISAIHGVGTGDLLDHVVTLFPSKDLDEISDSPVQLAIIGRPNVGKSSLLNLLAKKEKAIVTNIPGTTRDVIEVNLTINDIPMKIIDTAGIRETHEQIESIGIKKSFGKIKESDFIIYIYSLEEGFNEEDKKIIKEIPKEKLITIVGNKKDLIDSKNINSNELKNTILMSIKNNDGERLLIDTIIKKCGLKQVENINIFLNERHLTNLSACLSNLNDTDEIIKNRLPFDLLSIELRDGIQNLSKITGQELTEELLDNIFSKFCIGK